MSNWSNSGSVWSTSSDDYDDVYPAGRAQGYGSGGGGGYDPGGSGGGYDPGPAGSAGHSGVSYFSYSAESQQYQSTGQASSSPLSASLPVNHQQQQPSRQLQHPMTTGYEPQVSPRYAPASQHQQPQQRPAPPADLPAYANFNFSESSSASDQYTGSTSYSSHSRSDLSPISGRGPSYSPLHSPGVPSPSSPHSPVSPYTALPPPPPPSAPYVAQQDRSASQQSQQSQPKDSMGTALKLQRQLQAISNQSHGSRLPIVTPEVIGELATCLADNTVFEIFNEIEEIQRITERKLLNERMRVQNEHKTQRIDLSKEYKASLHKYQTMPHRLAQVKTSHQEKKQSLEKKLEEEVRQLDQSIILKIDQQVMEQQATLQQVGVPCFHVTNNKDELSLQMAILGLMRALRDKMAKK